MELHDDEEEDDSPKPDEGDEDGGDRDRGGEGAGEKDEDVGEVVVEDVDDDVTVVGASPRQIGVVPLLLQVVVVVVAEPLPITRPPFSSFIVARAGCKMIGVVEVWRVGGRRAVEVG